MKRAIKVMKFLVLALTVLPSVSHADETKCYVYINGGCRGVPVPVYAWFEEFSANNNNGICLHRAKDLMAQCRLIGKPGAAVYSSFSLNGVTINSQAVISGQTFTYGLNGQPLDTK